MTLQLDPKKRDVSNWASRIDPLLTPSSARACFDATPELNRQSQFSRYRNRSSIAEDRDVSPELDYDTTVDMQVAVTYLS